jgi:hypothetical protein
MAQAQVRDTTQTFIVAGGEIQETLNKRAKQHEGEIAKCLDKVAVLLKAKAADYETLAIQATGAMLALSQGKHMNSDSLEIKTQLDRAAYLTDERLDLLCIRRNLGDQSFYKVTLEEAKRYGLV